MNKKDKEDCQFNSQEECLATDMTPCDFGGEDYKTCLKYKLYFLRSNVMQLR